MFIYYIIYIYKLLCHLQKCQFIYIKNKTFILWKLYFGFFQTFEDSNNSHKINVLFLISIYLSIYLSILYQGVSQKPGISGQEVILFCA